jgi:hypothetical protein
MSYCSCKNGVHIGYPIPCLGKCGRSPFCVCLSMYKKIRPLTPVRQTAVRVECTYCRSGEVCKLQLPVLPPRLCTEYIGIAPSCAPRPRAHACYSAVTVPSAGRLRATWRSRSCSNVEPSQVGTKYAQNNAYVRLYPHTDLDLTAVRALVALRWLTERLEPSPWPYPCPLPSSSSSRPQPVARTETTLPLPPTR